MKEKRKIITHLGIKGTFIPLKTPRKSRPTGSYIRDILIDYPEGLTYTEWNNIFVDLYLKKKREKRKFPKEYYAGWLSIRGRVSKWRESGVVKRIDKKYFFVK